MLKGKSLMAYCDDADYEDVFKLLADLLEYYELNCMARISINRSMSGAEKLWIGKLCHKN